MIHPNHTYDRLEGRAFPLNDMAMVAEPLMAACTADNILAAHLEHEPGFTESGETAWRVLWEKAYYLYLREQNITCWMLQAIDVRNIKTLGGQVLLDLSPDVEPDA